MLIGLEKECLVFNDDLTPYSLAKESQTKNLQVDFADNQIEVISDINQTVPNLVKQMFKVLDNEAVVSKKMWPLSLPGELKYEPTFINYQGEKFAHRQKIAQKYDKQLLNISGIHFNFSLTKTEHDQTERYFELMKKIYVFGPLLQQFVSFSPYSADLLEINYFKEKQLEKYPGAISLRNSSKFGYVNEGQLGLEFTSYQAYKQSIYRAIEQNLISSEKELYSKVRIKQKDNEFYLEVRFIDLNPFSRLGIEVDMLYLLIGFFQYLEQIEINDFNYNDTLKNFETVSLEGLNKECQLNLNGHVASLEEHTISLFENMIKQTTDPHLKEIFQTKIKAYINKTLDLNVFLKKLQDEKLSQTAFGQKYAFQKEKYQELMPDKELELSTKILYTTAVNKGFEVEILDEKQNVLQINSELIVQATKTNFDRYANVLMLENKYMTKKILEKNQINVPQGADYTCLENISFEDFMNQDVVVKPVNTNFGEGITILTVPYTQAQFDQACKFAFSYDSRIIVESFFEGSEYRILVINNEVVSIVKRIPAHIVGDGKHSIAELVEIKNQNPLRGTKYQRPVELIEITLEVEAYLKQQNLKVDSVPSQGQTVFLRKNSNISTGGDSCEASGQLESRFLKTALKATKAMDVAICGIDMIINDEHTDYVIIEANFNPAIQMHTYPYYGIGVNPAEKILQMIQEKASRISNGEDV
ncbi:MAG: bifunctional glutamate--cysteine ligase GshA/glutathione synthetase GshB [Mycoplasmatales bacterium]